MPLQRQLQETVTGPGRLYIGVDPGQVGALVAIDQDGVVREVQTWRHGVMHTWEGREKYATRLPRLRISVELAHVVALERPFVGASAASSLSLAEWCGGALAQLEGLQVIRPFPMVWRQSVLGRGNLQREAAKEAAKAAYEKHRPEWATWSLGADEAEAWCLAEFARRSV